jgi:hypothetical protein
MLVLVTFMMKRHKILLHHQTLNQLSQSSNNAMRYGLFALILMLTACETTRENTITVKSRVKNSALTNCNVPDRCGITP